MIRNFAQRTITIFCMFLIFSMTQAAKAGSEHGGGAGSHGGGHDQNAPAHGTFVHQDQQDDLRAEFKIMSLAAMNMQDENDATHHIMVSLFRTGDDEPLKNIKGKIKVIGPDKQEQLGTLKDYGNVLAANFTFDQKGNYGIICLFRVENANRVFKFWYPHGQMSPEG